MSISTFQAVERYSSILRKVSFIHPSVISKFNSEIERIIGRVDAILIELDNSDSKTDMLFELRRHIFQLEDIVDIKVIQRYNELIDENTKGIVRSESISDSNKITSPRDVWDNVMAYLRDQLNVHTYNVWVRPVEYHSCDENKINVMVQNHFYKNWLEDHCSKLIKKHLEDIESDYEVTFLTG